MKRFILGITVLTALALAGRAGANPPTYPAPPPYNPAMASSGGSNYGLAPCLKNLFGVKKKCGKKCEAAVPYGPTGGTLVFPVNPFVRSPRDFFMQEP